MMKQPDLGMILQQRLSRRSLMQYAGIGAFMSMAMPVSASSKLAGTIQSSLLGFQGIPVANLLDKVRVPAGYHAKVFYRWGDPVSDGPEFKMDASNTAEDQLQQAGMHHDAIQFYPLDDTAEGEQHGLLVMNHEYIDPQILHADGGYFDNPVHYDKQKLLKEQYAHGVSVIEVVQQGREWHIVRPSKYARRITATTSMTVSGPAAGSHWLQTEADPQGLHILGTFNNCSNGVTPWGTYLTCEENFHDYFEIPQRSADVSQNQQKAWQRYDIKHSKYGWQHQDARFDLGQHPNEANRFGWIVELDPRDPNSIPVKRTAMGRFGHENVAHNIAADGRVAFYSGDDSRFEYIYKFVTKQAWDGTPGSRHGDLLNEGTLYVARFNEDGSGEWLPLVFGDGKLNPENGFSSQADVVVHARLAADAVGATPMDRPEWIAAHLLTGDIFVSLTNNNQRGDDGKPPKDAVNPRNHNLYGHIARLSEQDAAAKTFAWEVFVLAGDEGQQGTIHGDIFANPDGLMIDKRGVLWVQTDISSKDLNSGSFARFGNNQMLAVDPQTAEARRFLTGPVGCEITGVVMSPDMKTMWVNIQHPGEAVPEVWQKRGIHKSPENPRAGSNWPDHQAKGRPRSATVMIQREDGGIIGT